MIYTSYGENVVSHSTCKKWRQKCRQEDFSFVDKLRAGLSQKIDTEELQTLLHINAAQTKKELAKQFDVGVFFLVKETRL